MKDLIRDAATAIAAALGNTAKALHHATVVQGMRIHRYRLSITALAAAGLATWVLVNHPPFASVAHGEVGVRTNAVTGGASEVHEGSVLLIPGLQHLRRLSLRDQIYQPSQGGAAHGNGAFQSMEGLSIGVDLTVRYALDPTRVLTIANTLPENLNLDVVQPAVQGVIYKILTRYTVREIFSTKRAEIQQAIETELRPRLLADGVVLKGVQMGKVTLPDEYRAGMEKLLASELETEKMRYTLELKEKEVTAAGLEADADKARRERAAEAAASEQIIAAKGQEEAMKHVLPFKQKQIEQRQLEAEAEKVSRIKTAEGNAQARVIEASGEADSRHKLADVEAYRVEVVGKAESQQLARDGALITAHPLLIQKTLADKLSDKITVIIASPPASGGFIGANLLGADKTAATPAPAVADTPVAAKGEE